MPVIQGDTLSVTFDRFGRDEYPLYLRFMSLPEKRCEYHPDRGTYTLRTHARFADRLGLAAPRPPVSDLAFGEHLFDDQQYVTRKALWAKRFAAYMQCGLGKTPIGLEYARQAHHKTGGRVLIVTLSEIIREWLDMAQRFYGDTLPIRRINTRAELLEWMRSGEGIAITNYEKFNPEGRDDQTIKEAAGVAGLVLDEASRLRTQGGVQKWALIHSFEHTEYKLLLSATPAPNDLFEFCSQAGMLNQFRTENSINAFFSKDKEGKWVVKPHARDALFAWMASWSIWINDPKSFGWRNGFPDVPKPDYRITEIPATEEQREYARKATLSKENRQTSLVPSTKLGIVQRSRLSQIAKGFRYHNDGGKRQVESIPSHKPAAVKRIVADEVAGGNQVLVWTIFDEESAILAREMADIPGVAVLTGKTTESERVRILEAFRAGEIRVLISLASVLGFGMNFQFVRAMVFAGFDDSFERMYQAVRRAVRFGQDEQVRVCFPVIRELEGDTLDNIWSKHDRYEATGRDMEAAYRRVIATERKGTAV